ncbi:MAG: hypothetical protein ALECFALPRED_009506 [Alectoria fallacina]|uniref:Rhodopsin domain-containing protein n=1 Tax=Alectoria fallacina TaxID=1903189 RepID=A0A8H3EVG2_9LECA|nr:MAG: hypothetical protein ALECFALPRED_009506 [Alectoria fallacina]
MLPAVTPRGEIAMGSVMPALGLAAVALRLCSKRRIRRFGVDDWLAIVSMILALGLGALLIIGAKLKSFGRASPASDAGFYEDDKVLVTAKKLEFIFDIVQIWALGTVKLSVIFFYRGIFRGNPFNIASWTMVGVVIAWTLGTFFAVAFQCAGHFALLWSSAASIASHCSEGSAIGLGFSTLDVITDGLILMMPLYWMPSANQLTPISSTIIASIIRLTVYVILYPSHNSVANQVGMCFYPGVLGMTDKLTAPTAFYSTILYWSMLEIGLSVIAACLPTLAPLFRDVPAEQINKLMRNFFTLPSRSSGTVASVSETRIVRETDAENYWGIESYAMGDTEGQHGEVAGQGRETNGRILITTGISRHSSIDGDEL